jgi:hypothetical protein
MDELQHPEKVILPVIHRADFSWEHFVHMGSNHLVLPALYVKFRNNGLLSALPDDLAMHLQKLYTMNVDRNRQLIKQIEWLTTLLCRSGIHPVLLKGSGSLVEGLYPDQGERILADIDCMVKESEVEAAVTLLRSEGYEARPFHPASLPMMHHYPALFKPHEPAPIEIHHIPVGRRQLKYINMDEWTGYLFSSGNEAPLTLRTGDQIIVNMIHGLLKNRGQYYANLSLRNMYEFYRLSWREDPAGVQLPHPRLRMIYNNYLAVASRLFQTGKAYPVEKRWRTMLYIKRFELNKSSRLYNKLSWAFRSGADLMYTYFSILLRSLIRKEYRRYLMVRLSNLKWYRHHLSVLRKRFSFRDF